MVIQIGLDIHMSRDVFDRNYDPVSGRIGDVCVVPETWYPEARRMRIVVDGQPSGLATMRGTRHGYRQARSDMFRSAPQNIWELEVASRLGKLCAPKIAHGRPVFLRYDCRKKRFGAFGLNASCHEKYLNDRFSGAAMGRVRNDDIRDVKVMHVFASGHLWLATIAYGARSGLRQYDIAEEIAESIRLEAATTGYAHT